MIINDHLKEGHRDDGYRFHSLSQSSGCHPPHMLFFFQDRF